ncbi:radical SAM family heme chaperone HemW [Sneathiella chinensis]|uniref:Heme chaperone HemW n=1 Tax=Sneathiella chinensis TaxID=349750 RepID=A0ABQ5TZH4_9PROT|nr:radical SAM family heme chaperone HemW [Sneathiella chinensis]GLQ05272.1 coproporphyrinogen III oxidase [Sneathiella chinensis]
MPVSSNHNVPDRGFGVYFHWPFCRKKCPYCDFNSHVREAVDQKVWTDALLRELDWFASQCPSRPVTSIFFGGGTPSLMAPETVAALIDGVRRHFPLSDTLEISLEANPTSAEAQSFKGYRQAGVNRLSMGVQSLHDEALAFLGREHSVAEALATIELARDIFPNISFDLIYALPGQSVQEWTADLKQALSMAGDHLSLYQLTIEPNTGFAGAVRRGEFSLPPEENADALYTVTQEICLQAGLPAYEISNHARPGFECRHNLTYWRYGDYLGIGPGAHGRSDRQGVRTAFSQVKKPEKWLEAVSRSGHGTEVETGIPDPEDRAEEMLLMGLRLSEGVWFRNFEQVVGQPFSSMIRPERVERLVAGGFLTHDAGRIVATDRGRSVLNGLLGELLG